ncbi:hypothetical protein G6F40_018087 [Rhizopus arrhizus]|nr:hypothetical protein G6F40_018087 [Rhizopus arrhizus]KAG1242795.1 hypothetical protein G6F65_022820 [Rhizopus arrhizus]
MLGDLQQLLQVPRLHDQGGRAEHLGLQCVVAQQALHIRDVECGLGGIGLGLSGGATCHGFHARQRLNLFAPLAVR